jgi:hypothetical protein
MALLSVTGVPEHRARGARVRRRAVFWVVLIAIGLVTALFRFLAIAGLTNDHYVHLAGGYQISLGDWPTRDFVDFGLPLQMLLSAGAIALVPDAPLFGDAVLTAVMFGLAAIVTGVAARRLTGSTWIALFVVVLQVASFPRTYSYPKMLTYAAGALAMWRYIDRPSFARVVQFGVVVLLSFLLRYDHGVFLGVGGLLMVALAASPEGIRAVGRRTAVYVGVMVALLLPYLVYLEVNEGLVSHIQRGSMLGALERSRGVSPPAFDFDASGGVLAAGVLAGNAVPWLYYCFWMLPIVSVIVSVITAWATGFARSAGASGSARAGVMTGSGRDTAARAADLATIVPLAAVAVLVNVYMMRDTLAVRIPDAIVPASLLLGWLVSRAWRSRWSPAGTAARMAVTLVVVVTAASVVVIGETREQLDRAGASAGLTSLPETVASRTAQLRARFSPEQIPSSTAFALLPFFEYVDRCLGQADRIFIPAYFPEAVVWARRPFAGGQIYIQGGTLLAPVDHRLIIDRLHRQRVPVALIDPDVLEAFAPTFPELGDYVQGSFSETWLTPAGARAAAGPEVRFDTRLATGRDAATGWPCFR